MINSSDLYNLSRFLQAQENSYEQTLSEIRSGRKESHWMWFVFPQIDGLAFSSTAKRYAIKSIDHAKAYLEHPTLGPRLLICTKAALRLEGRSTRESSPPLTILKLASCATLFACVSHLGSVFERLLEKYYQGKRDEKALTLFRFSPETKPQS